ncbi:MAG: hypothetical protein PHU63_04730 [Candidatus ainarchaeum sp.]|nr:hypothetical protein [Candidatus ainarchaeum sp.]
MKCSKCNKKVEKTFLDKPKGTYIRTKGKLDLICSECQKEESNNKK